MSSWAGLDRRPPGRLRRDVPPRRQVGGGRDAEVGRLDAQGGVVRHHRRRALLGLTEGGADDPVVRARRVEAVLDEQVLVDAVELDLQAAAAHRAAPAWASEPPWRTRRSSIVRRAVRAARPTSSSRVFRPSSSSTTISGITTSASSNVVTHPGSAIRTDVSSTTRRRLARPGGTTAGRRSVNGSPRHDASERPATAAGLRHDGGSMGSVPNGVLLYRRRSHPMVDGRAAPDGYGRMNSMAECVFCAIVAGDAPAEIVHRDDVAVAFLDRTPLFAGHVLVVPTAHVVTLPDLDRRRSVLRARAAAGAAPCRWRWTRRARSWRMNNVVSQSVPHLHVHVVPRTKGDGLRGFFWPRRRYAAGEAAAVGDAVRASARRAR